MNSLISVLAFVCATTAFAEGGKVHNQTTSHPTQQGEAMTKTGAESTKLDKNQAKKECLKENKMLKGKTLDECIKSKTM